MERSIDTQEDNQRNPLDELAGGDPIVRNLRKKPILMKVNGVLYDIALFADKHPGGIKVLKQLAGQDVDDYMEGKERVFGVKHKHSATAYRILERYSLDKCFEETDDLLSGKPILNDVGDLGDRYWTWIHQPYEGSLRLFQSDFLENLTRTSWWMVPLVWLPFVIAFTFRAFSLVIDNYGFKVFGDLGFFSGLFVWAVLFTLGVLAWTLLEYIVHRFAFHWRPNPNSRLELILHFLLHGLHHKTPMDGYRLVFPPAAAALFVALFYLIYMTLLPYHMFYCFTAGKLFGYVIYDCSHYYFHHGDPMPYTNLHYRKVYHHNHHYKDYDLAFGISTDLWDYVFDTIGTGPM